MGSFARYLSHSYAAGPRRRRLDTTLPWDSHRSHLAALARQIQGTDPLPSSAAGLSDDSASEEDETSQRLSRGMREVLTNIRSVESLLRDVSRHRGTDGGASDSAIPRRRRGGGGGDEDSGGGAGGGGGTASGGGGITSAVV